MTAYELGGVLMGTPDSRDPDRCRWFRWMGGNCCEECGGSPFAHDGISWLKPGATFPFGAPDEDNQVYVAWADYGPGRTLNVPLLTLLMRNGTLEALQRG